MSELAPDAAPVPAPAPFLAPAETVASAAPVPVAAPVVEAPAEPTPSPLEALKAFRTDLIFVEGAIRKVVSGGSTELATFWQEVVEVLLADHADLDAAVQALNELAHTVQMAHQAGAS